jgi:hypothetical protein
MDLKGYLSRPFAVGGLGLLGQAFDFADRIIEEEYAKINSFKYNKTTKEDQIDVNLPNDPLFSAQNNQVSDDSIPKPQTKDEQVDKDAQAEINKLIMSEDSVANIQELILKEPSFIKESPNIPLKNITEDKNKDKKIDLITPDQNSMVYPRRSQAQSGKVRLDDIKFHSDDFDKQSNGGIKAFGLADEFGTITLSDYRGMGGTDVANEKLLTKISVLEKESIENKSAGIKSFRKSPLYQQYLSIGEESLLKNKKLSEVILDTAINPERMSEDEFYAISALNSKLR